MNKTNSRIHFEQFCNSNPGYSYWDVWQAACKFQSTPFFGGNDSDINKAMLDDDIFMKDVKHVANLVGIKENDNKLYCFAHELEKLRTSRLFAAVYGV